MQEKIYNYFSASFAPGLTDRSAHVAKRAYPVRVPDKKPDPSLLALVIDDQLAPKVLAAWKAERLEIGALDDDEDALEDFAELVGTDDTDALCATLRRCKSAGLLLDGTISGSAEGFLSVLVGRFLGALKKPAKPAKDRSK